MDSSKKLFKEVNSSHSGVDFINEVHNSEDFNIFNYRNFYNGGGVAIGDVNNDGLPDVFFTSNMGANRLYLNEGDFKFKDISETAGVLDENKWSTGVAMVDINLDGYLDIYVCNAGYRKGSKQNNTLYINNKDLTFTESASEWGLDEEGYTTHASFFDYDKDGDLDLYILNNSFIPVNTLNYSNKRNLRAKDWPVEEFLKGGGDKLLRNDGNTFVDVSEESGIFGSLIGFGLGVTIGDVNNDKWPDIYVSNDFFERDYLYINDKNGKFKEDLPSYIDHISHSSMGADMADINNDGLSDIFVTDMLPIDPQRRKKNASFDDINLFKLKTKSGFYNQYMQNTLQLNSVDNRFKEISNFANVAASDWSWGALMFDMDNDSNTDIYVCNGIYKDVVDLDFIDFFANDVVSKMALGGKKEELFNIIEKMPSTPIVNNVFRNNGDLTFSESAQEWGLDKESFSNGAAYGDLDNDGDLDLVVNNVNQQSQIFKNNSSANYLRVKLKGQEKNTFAIGAKLKLYVEGKILLKELVPNRGFQSSVDYTSIFGLGEYEKIDSLIVIWPDGKETKHMVEAVNQDIEISQSEINSSLFVDSNKSTTTKTLLEEVPFKIEAHKENDYVDFYYERNIPSMYSQEGPKIGVADLNGDGQSDIYFSGAKGQAGQFMLSSNGQFVQSEKDLLEKLKDFEDTAVAFFDADSDGDQDLFVGSGGNEQLAHNPLIADRLLINDGKGNYDLSKDGLPNNRMNTSAVLPYDFDGDELIDLFVGNLNLTRTYGVSPNCFIYKNLGNGKFESFELPKEMRTVGMIKDAAWIDLMGDDKKELVVVGEWMAPSIFQYNGEGFVKVESSLSKLYGFWNSVSTADIDKDGDQDLILGNIGKNVSFKAEENDPLRIFVYDFDQNGEFDKIITYSDGNKNYPIFSKRELTEQLPILKKKNLMHKDFATKGIEDLFDKKLLDAASRKGVSYLPSCIAINNGQGNFKIKELPIDVQLSCVNAILPIDIDEDGDEDLVIGGNNFDFLPQFSRLDASRGHLLINDGKGNFEVLNQTGLSVKGEVQDIKLLSINNQRHILVGINNESPKLFKILK